MGFSSWISTIRITVHLLRTSPTFQESGTRQFREEGKAEPRLDVAVFQALLEEVGLETQTMLKGASLLSSNICHFIISSL